MFGALPGSPAALVRKHAPEVSKFAVVGGIGYLVDVVLFNLLRSFVGIPALPAKAVSLTVATTIAFVGNLRWTYGERTPATATATATAHVRGQYLLFVGWSCGGMAIQIACLALSHHVFGFDSLLADNISGNVIGMALATVFRFWAYRTRVFRPTDGSSDPKSSAAAVDSAPLWR
ncbi:GtrA family protein [Embleya sp. NBC_00896]|uniref:GtrA family protein n=1 Tax=Embleya sp. NBC_00896 TaxID=2975961 RepID=UPI00386DCEEE|nr:GtrA family protein [Embleya sp. NBC_00896]